MNIIGITGPIGHGKTSLAEAFLRQVSPAEHTESSILISKVADQLNKQYSITQPKYNDSSSINVWLVNLPDIIRDVTGFTGNIPTISTPTRQTAEPSVDFDKLYEYLDIVATNPSLVTQTITPGNKESYRPILQWLGAYITKHISPTLWYDKLVQQAHEAETSGCKLFIIGGVRFPSDAQVIHQAGGHVIAIERPDVNQRDTQDATEAFRSMIPVDATIINDHSLGALDSAVLQIWQDVQRNDIQKIYHASRLNTESLGTSSISIPRQPLL